MRGQICKSGMHPTEDRRLVDVVGLGDKSIDLVKLAVVELAADDKAGGLTSDYFLFGNLSIPCLPPICHPCLTGRFPIYRLFRTVLHH